MAGLGLMNAVKSYQDGVAWRQGQEQYERQQKQQALGDDAEKAAAGVIEASRAEWALNGAQGQYQPSDTTLMKAAEARGRAFATGGDWQSYLKNEAAVQRQRIRVRASALQQYEQNGDPIALAQTVYPTVFDGKEVTKVEKVGGMPALPSIGKAASPAVLRYTLSDGTEGEMPVDAMVKRLKQSLVDPVTAAEKEIELNFLRTKSEIEGDKEIRVAGAKGDQERQTEGVRNYGALRLEDRKAGHAIGLADAKFGHDEKLHTMDNASRERVGAGNNTATVQAAEARGDAIVEAAGLRGLAGGGAAGGGSKGLLKTASDADGNVILYFRDGTTRKASDPDTGKPLKAGEWGKRIDGMAKTLKDDPSLFGKTPAEVRRIAAETLASGAPAAAPAPKPAASGPGLASFDGKGAERPPLSNFLKK